MLALLAALTMTLAPARAQTEDTIKPILQSLTPADLDVFSYERDHLGSYVAAQLRALVRRIDSLSYDTLTQRTGCYDPHRKYVTSRSIPLEIDLAPEPYAICTSGAYRP